MVMRPRSPILDSMTGALVIFSSRMTAILRPTFSPVSFSIMPAPWRFMVKATSGVPISSQLSSAMARYSPVTPARFLSR